MTARCPSDLALEELLLSPHASAHRGHVDGCAACQARLAEMRRQGEDFARTVFPATVEAVEDAAEGRGGRRWLEWLGWLAPAFAAAGAVFLLVRPAGPPDDYAGLKGGGGVGLAVYVRRGSGVELARDGEKVPAAAALRFQVRPSGACRLWIVSLDATGQVSRLVPADGDGGLALDRTTELPGGVVLDGQPGPERILAFCAPEPVAWARVEGAVRRAASPGPDAVRALRQVPGLPAGTVADTVLLEKTP
jgi:hypothetical protein